MGLILTSTQQAALKRVRAMRWNKPFTVSWSSVATEQDEFYDEPVEPEPATEVLSGDYTWRPEHGYAGREGGMIDQANLLLCTDLDHADKFVFSGARVIVDSTTYAITGVTKYPDFGEVVVTAKRVE